MNVSIREHIINNFQGDDYESLKDAIEESIKSMDEVVLPGLGVFFEIVWNGSTQEMKNEMIDIIKNRVKEGYKKEATD